MDHKSEILFHQNETGFSEKNPPIPFSCFKTPAIALDQASSSNEVAVESEQDGISHSNFAIEMQPEECYEQENDDSNEDEKSYSEVNQSIPVTSTPENMCYEHNVTVSGNNYYNYDDVPTALEGIGNSSRKYDRMLTNPSAKPKIYFCSICNKGFNRKSNMVVHEKIHSAEPRVKSFVCSVCNKAFGTKSNLHCHIRIHTGEKPFKCPMCDKAFTVSSSLHAHVRIHTGERPYVCDVCGKGFTECSQLQKHRRNHTGERPYKCPNCGSGFTQKSSLDSHMKMHTGDKPYQCSICSKVCRTSSEVQVHMRVHTGERPYKCSVCDMAFSRPDSVEKHMRTHTGEKPYSCEVCNKSFTVSSALHRHLKTHTGEKPYICVVCNKAFGESGNLNKHMRKIHNSREEEDNNCDLSSTFSKKKSRIDQGSVDIPHDPTSSTLDWYTKHLLKTLDPSKDNSNLYSSASKLSIGDNSDKMTNPVPCFKEQLPTKFVPDSINSHVETGVSVKLIAEQSEGTNPV